MTGFATPPIQTERLTLRPPRAEDAAPYVAMFQTERVQYMLPVQDEFGAWKAWYTELGHWAQRGYGMFTVTWHGDETPLGLVGPWFPHTWPAQEIGWMVYPDHEGKGIAQEAALAARQFAYGTLGWTTAISFIEPGNTRSIALAERLGCTVDADCPVPDDGDLAYRHPGPEVH